MADVLCSASGAGQRVAVAHALCNLGRANCKSGGGASAAAGGRNRYSARCFRAREGGGTALAFPETSSPRGECAMNLYIWLPALFALGLLTLGLMFVFVGACERV